MGGASRPFVALVKVSLSPCSYQTLHLFLLTTLKIPLAVPLILITAHKVAD